ncbi:MAG: hypothetical protein BA871_08100 [Desulfuromonadales bacterium C00003096]|jgi:hypothetical protein|nr:MAG: hypothetical protein BA871_08100 [Desulfuromonadales bacterium C00003096]
MAGKIFYRERKKFVDGSKNPRYLVGAVADVNLKVYGKHMRMSELKQIAEELGAELVHLKRGPKH